MYNAETETAASGARTKVLFSNIPRSALCATLDSSTILKKYAYQNMKIAQKTAYCACKVRNFFIFLLWYKSFLFMNSAGSGRSFQTHFSAPDFRFQIQ
jgi:hypothetical protein